ncbi:cobalamin-dependent protein [Streptomyces sp. ZYX-F-203]
MQTATPDVSGAAGHPAPGTGLRTLLTGTSSDAHTWNLVYLRLLLSEWGHYVTTLGPCVPESLLVAEALRLRPDLIVVSSVNGHGATDALRLITAVRQVRRLADVPVVIGGKLGTAGRSGTDWAPRLRAAGFSAVFDEDAGMPPFRGYVDALTAGVCR